MYMALTGSEWIESEWSLPALLRLLEEIQEEEEDVVIWKQNRVVCVRRGDGVLVWMQPRHRPVA